MGMRITIREHLDNKYANILEQIIRSMLNYKVRRDVSTGKVVLMFLGDEERFSTSVADKMYVAWEYARKLKKYESVGLIEAFYLVLKVINELMVELDAKPTWVPSAYGTEEKYAETFIGNRKENGMLD